MNDQSQPRQTYPHQTIAWAKQRLTELDAIISEAEKSADKLKGSISSEADKALARLKASRLRIQKHYDDLRTETDEVKRVTKEGQAALDSEWVEVESTLQSFLTAVAAQAGTVRDMVVARVQAQRQSWEASLQGLRDQTAEAVEKGRRDLDTAIRRLSDEVEKFQAKIGEAKSAGDESWQAVKNGLAEAKSAYDRTITKIKDTVSRVL